MSAYGRDLARIHDEGYGQFARYAAPGLLRLLARAGIRDGWRRSDEEHVLHLHEPAEVLSQLAAAGFESRRLRGYGSAWRFPRGWAGFAADKPR